MAVLPSPSMLKRVLESKEAELGGGRQLKGLMPWKLGEVGHSVGPDCISCPSHRSFMFSFVFSFLHIHQQLKPGLKH